MRKRIVKFCTVAGEAAARGALIVAALLLLVSAGELWFRPLSEITSQIFAAFAAFCGVSFLALQWLLFKLVQKNRAYRGEAQRLRSDMQGYKAQLRAIDHRRQQLNRRVNELTALCNMDQAVVNSDSFDDFMNTIARLARDNNGARELTVFTCDQESPFPLATYQLTEVTELCLTFNTGGGAAIASDLAEHGSAIPSRFSASAMSITESGRQLVINGELLYSGAPAGRMRLTVLNSDPDNRPGRDVLRRLVATWLSSTALDNNGIRQAIANDGPVAASGRRGLIRFATVLRCGEEVLGAMRMGFATNDGNNLYEQQKALSTAAARVAHALKNEKIYEQAIKDGLTGLYNKRHMMATAERLMQLAARHGSPLCMILIDIDHFKKVNDTWGHLSGDIILREVSAILVECARASDMPCRYGGEELAVILPEENLAGALKLAERIRSTIERKQFISDKGKPLHITASFGVSSFGKGMEQVEDLIAAADEALYAAKHGGRNRVVSAGPQRRAALA